MSKSYMTVGEAAAKWHVSERRVRALFEGGLLAGARKSGDSRTARILIPAGLQKPPDGRRARSRAAFPELVDLYATCDEKRARLERLKPFGENARAALRSYDEDFMLRFVYNSNAIEGSTLTLQDTELVLEGEFVADQDARWQFAARGVYEGTLHARKLSDRGARLSRELIQDVHERTALDLQPAARGVFRRYPVYIRGSKTVPADWESIYDALDQLVYDHAHFEGNDLERAALFHCRFERIHPFGDGNGRTGRILLNTMLEKCGYPPVALKAKRAREYFSALESAQTDDAPQGFIRILAEQVIEELEGRLHAVESAGADATDPPRSFLVYRCSKDADGARHLIPVGRHASLLDAIDAATAMADSRTQPYAVFASHQDVLADAPLWSNEV